MGFLVPLISTRHRLIKSIFAQGVGGASVLFAQFKCFIKNVGHVSCSAGGTARLQTAGTPVFGVWGPRAVPKRSSWWGGASSLCLVKGGPWRIRDHKTVNFPLCSMRTSKAWKCVRHTEWLPFDWTAEKGRYVERQKGDNGQKEPYSLTLHYLNTF